MGVSEREGKNRLLIIISETLNIPKIAKIKTKVI